MQYVEVNVWEIRSRNTWGTQSESNLSDTKSYEGEGNTVQCHSLWEMKGLGNIYKNDLREVKMMLKDQSPNL
jgi:hypothetical protein